MSSMVDLHLNQRWWIKVPDHRAARPEYHQRDGWEGARLRHMSEHVGSGDVVYYVGAEEGEHPALCQMWGAQVVLFEPNPKVWPNIKAIWEANKLKNPLGTYQGFASNEVTQGELAKDWPSCVNDEIIGNHGFKELYLEAKNYDQTTIDYVSDHFVAPTVISMDVEGSEYEVLKGAEQTILTYKPKIYLSLHPEFLYHQWNVYGREVRDWIIDRGYTETLLDYQHEVHLYYESLPAQS